MAATGTAHRTWNRHLILAEIKMRFGSLRAMAETTSLGIGHFSVALRRPYPKAEQIIAGKLGIPVQELWPDRYDSKGRRRPNGSRARTRAASPKAAVDADTGAVQ